MSRTKIATLANRVVSCQMSRDPGALAVLINKLAIWDSSGLYVALDPMRGYGLFASRPFSKGELITKYGGIKYPATSGVCGDYAAWMDRYTILNGRYGFKLGERGRWCNEFNADREVVNASLGREVRAICEIRPGDQIFVDYGTDYVRDYN